MESNKKEVSPSMVVTKGLISAVVAAFAVWMVTSMFMHGQLAFAILFTIVIAAGLAVSWFKGLDLHDLDDNEYRRHKEYGVKSSEEVARPASF